MAVFLGGRRSPGYCSPHAVRRAVFLLHHLHELLSYVIDVVLGGGITAGANEAAQRTKAVRAATDQNTHALACDAATRDDHRGGMDRRRCCWVCREAN